MSDGETTLGRIREILADFAHRPKQVKEEEVKQVINMLSTIYVTGSRKARHGYLYTVGTERFMVNSHNKGDSHVKGYSVQELLKAMARLGVYEEG
jgi:hypothetical protein